MWEKLNGAPSVNNLSREPTAHQANKQSVRKRLKATVLASVLQVTCSCHELQPQENKYDVISIYDKFVTLFCFTYSFTKHVRW